MAEWALLLAAVVLTAGTGVFVAAEFSLVALDRSGVQRAVDAGDTRARRVLHSVTWLATQLSAAQVGITLTTLVVGYLAEPSLGSLLTGPLTALGLSEGAVETAATTLALALATVFSMVFGELVPQFLGLSAPLRTAKAVALPVQAFAVVARPLIALLNGSANIVLRAIGITPREELSGARTPQELASLVRRSAEAGTPDLGVAQMLTRSLVLGERTAADVMTPRVRCTGVERTDSAESVVALARRTGHSRFPVIGRDWDDIEGLVHLKRVVAVPRSRRPDVPVSALMVPHASVPETIRLTPLLQQLRAAGLQVAVVVDEYGGTSGLVTLEDVVEEIVGEVRDEHDPSRSAGHRLPDGSWTVPGLWRPDEALDRLGVPVPDSAGYETLGGFVMARLGRVPRVGDLVELPGWRLTVVAMDRRRVAGLRVESRPEAAEQEGEHPAARTRSEGTAS